MLPIIAYRARLIEKLVSFYFFLSQVTRIWIINFYCFIEKNLLTQLLDLHRPFFVLLSGCKSSSQKELLNETSNIGINISW